MKFGILLIFWVLAVGTSFHFLLNYSGQEGKVGDASILWPSDTQLSAPSAYHLVMFVHPGCSCSKASLAELSRIMSQQKNLTTEVVFMKTKKLDSLFKDNELVKTAKSLPRTKVSFDPNGKEAKIFGAMTSGQSYLYHPEKGLLFSGGLTAARGHEGRSTGQEAIEKILKNKPARNIASVFGCDFFGESTSTGKL